MGLADLSCKDMFFKVCKGQRNDVGMLCSNNICRLCCSSVEMLIVHMDCRFVVLWQVCTSIECKALQVCVNEVATSC